MLKKKPMTKNVSEQHWLIFIVIEKALDKNSTSLHYENTLQM